jgi:hypothetical protein
MAGPTEGEMNMRFLMIYTPASAAPPTAEKMAAIGKFSENMAKTGKIVSTGGLLPNGGKLRLSKGQFTDGPFPEAKEVVIGWAVVDVTSKEEAIEVARRFLAVAGDGESEIRQIVGQSI